MEYFIGIDLGGTFIKGGIVDKQGNILVKDKTPTQANLGNDKVVNNIARLCESLLKQANINKDGVKIGVGTPGIVDSEKGIVVLAENLGWDNFPVAEKLTTLTGMQVKLGNDANAAALGETKFGSGKAYENTVFVTLGTGVGGGVIIDGKLFEGVRSAGTELGHTVIKVDGEKCSCGRKGCLEAYASATALIRETKRAMQKNPASKLWEVGDLDKVTGKTAFDYYSIDKTAKKVVDKYIKMLGVGLTNFANEFRPEAILLGGGVCAQGDSLIKPLQKFVDKEIFAGPRGPQVKILKATLENDAGLLGAAALVM